MIDDDDPTFPADIALARYQVISAYIALDPPRGQRRALLEQLAARPWPWTDRTFRTVAAETIRSWIRRYRRGGLPSLYDAPRTRPGVQALDAELQELARRMKRDVPERSLDQIIRILERTERVDPGTVSRSTLHRVLQEAGLRRRPRPTGPDDTDLDRFEADAPNDMWQSDLLHGPWLPDPTRPGKKRRAYLYAFLDDHSRLLLYGRFSFKGDLPALELVLRRSLQRHGVPRRVYYDNGLVYRSRHMKQIIAAVGTQGIAFTTKHRPMGHGKIEKLNGFITSNFIAEVKSSSIRTLDALNEAFVAWVERDYNRRFHTEVGEAPRTRWQRGVERVRFVDEQVLHEAFLWRESRTADKTGLFSLFGTRYQVGRDLARKKLEIRYDPERLEEVEVWHDDRFRERVTPFSVRTHRRPRPAPIEPGPPSEPAVDYLGYLVAERRREGRIDPDPRDVARNAAERRRQASEALVALFEERLDAEVVDRAAIVDFGRRYGPLDVDVVGDALDAVITVHDGRTDHHIRVYLDAVRQHITTPEAP